MILRIRLGTLGGTGAFITPASGWDHQTCPGVRGMTQNFVDLLSSRAPKNLAPILRTARAISGKEFYELHKEATTPERLSSDSAKRMA